MTDRVLASVIGIVLVAFTVGLLLGAVWGSADKICVTAESQGSTVIYCANGKPTANLKL